MNSKAKQYIDQITDKIKRSYSPVKIILFGSYAYGTSSKDSDIDLLVIMHTNAPRLDRFVELKRLVFNPKRDIPFSPIVLTPEEVEERSALGDDFIIEILTKGKILYEQQ